MAQVQLDAISLAYQGIFPASAAVPTVDQLADEWAACLTTSYVALVDGSVVGTIALRPFPDDPSLGQLRRLHTAPAAWGLGIGSALHDFVLETLAGQGFSTAVLWVLEANERARSMYERRGWVPEPGARLKWKGLGVDEVQYRRPLP